MKLDIVYNDNKAIVKVFGRIDTITSESFRTETQKVDFSKINEMAIDFKNVEYISSAGLRELLILRKKFSNGDNFKIINVNDAVMEIFKVTGFDSIMNICKGSLEDKHYLELSCKDILALKYKNCPNEVYMIADKPYTWEEVEKCSQAVAQDLSNAGVKKGSHVAICGVNSANWIFTFFATQKLGAIAVLLNSGLKENEIIALSKIGDITHLCIGNMFGVSDYDLLFNNLISNPNSMIKSIIDIRNSVDFLKVYEENKSKDLKVEQVVEVDDPAVMIFSSGTTGTPKGVMLSAYNIIFSTLSTLERVPGTEQDIVCNILPFFHIFGLVSGVFSAIISNCKLLLPADLRSDTVLSAIDKNKCTVFCTVPTMMLALINNPNFTKEKVESLKYCILGGAAVSEAQLYVMSEKFTNTSFGIVYGLSELAPATMTRISDSLQKVATSIGCPCNGVELMIANNGADNSEKNRIGEILLRGDNLMTCYYKLDIDSQAVDDDGWLHTGDLGYVDEDGYVHIAGRIKELIIRGGENILPNEIVSAISQHPAITDVKVIGIPDEYYGEIVVAGIIPKKDTIIDADELNKFLSTRIAKFKIPAHYFFYDLFPMLPNGKVDVITLKKDIIEKLK